MDIPAGDVTDHQCPREPFPSVAQPLHCPKLYDCPQLRNRLWSYIRACREIISNLDHQCMRSSDGRVTVTSKRHDNHLDELKQMKFGIPPLTLELLERELPRVLQFRHPTLTRPNNKVDISANHPFLIPSTHHHFQKTPEKKSPKTWSISRPTYLSHFATS